MSVIRAYKQCNGCEKIFAFNLSPASSTGTWDSNKTLTRLGWSIITIWPSGRRLELCPTCTTKVEETAQDVQLLKGERV